MDVLSLHEDYELALPYKEYPGKLAETALQVLGDGRTHFSIADYMERIAKVQHSPKVLQAWMERYFDFTDAVARHPEGNARIVGWNASLQDLLLQKKVANGVIELTPEEYGSLGGLHLSRTLVEEYNGKKLCPADAERNEVLNYWAGDGLTLGNFLAVLAQNTRREGLVSILFPPPRNVPYLQFWGVSGCSRTFGCHRVDDESAYLLGVRKR